MKTDNIKEASELFKTVYEAEAPASTQIVFERIFSHITGIEINCATDLIGYLIRAMGEDGFVKMASAYAMIALKEKAIKGDDSAAKCLDEINKDIGLGL